MDSSLDDQQHVLSSSTLEIFPSDDHGAALRARRPSGGAPRLMRPFAALNSESEQRFTSAALVETAVDDEDDDKKSIVTQKAENSGHQINIAGIPLPPSLYIERSSAHIPAASLLYNSAPTTPGTATIRGFLEEDHIPFEPVLEAPPPERFLRRLFCSFLAYFTCGWADGTPGTLLPYLERDYDISYLTVSFLFVASTVGFAVGTVCNEPLMLTLGRFSTASPRRGYLPYLKIPFASSTTSGARREQNSGHSLPQGRFWLILLAACLQLGYFSIASSKPPFYGMLVAFFLGGMATSLFTGQLNAYVAGSPKAGRALGHLHGFYGVGACVSPLVSQTILGKGMPWPTFYYVSLSLAALNCSLIVWAFHPTLNEFKSNREGTLALAQESASAEDITLHDIQSGPNDTTRVRRPGPTRRSSSMPKSTMRQTLSIPYVWIFATFLCLYTGSETTVGGWIVTFLLTERNANPKTVGYVATGFWGGMALGRLSFGQASPYIGIHIEKHLVHVFILIAIIMQFLTWFVPSFIGNAICTAIVGFVLGPLFPTSLSLATKILPPEVHMTALATMSSFASIGSAMFPFITGVLANAKGVKVIQPVVLSLLGIMSGLWCFFPSRFRERV